MHPEHKGWTLTNQLLAIIADCLRWLQWVKTKDGRNNVNAPKPIDRPGVGTSRRDHPKGKGLKRSRLKNLLYGYRSKDPERLTKLRNLFASKD